MYLDSFGILLTLEGEITVAEVKEQWMITSYVRILAIMFFFYSIHPTERVDQIISQLMWSGNQSIAGPYNLKTLFEE